MDYSNVKLPRGLRNNNPGNIVKSSTQWAGQASKELQTDPNFVVFSTMAYGLRALMKNLLTYYNKHQLVTVSQIIKRWAPPHENNTQAYIEFVSKQLGVSSNEPLHMDKTQLITLTKAIVIQENGRSASAWVTPSMYEKAYELIGEISIKKK